MKNGVRRVSSRAIQKTVNKKKISHQEKNLFKEKRKSSVQSDTQKMP